VVEVRMMSMWKVDAAKMDLESGTVSARVWIEEREIVLFRSK
jgi:hypothetical protein